MPNQGKRDRKRDKESKSTTGFELKPTNYQPSKEELEEDLRLPASFDQVVQTLFAGDRKKDRQTKRVRVEYRGNAALTRQADQATKTR